MPAAPDAGLPRLPASVDTQPGFLQEMLRRIATRPELGGLLTRDVDDPSIALLDAAATMLDVLAFYGDLITNEGYLRTATERRSVQELARGIGYELAPGVAASTVLAFRVDPPPGAGPVVRLPAGLQAQKLPGDDGATAVYETSEEVLARGELNDLRLLRVEPAVPRFGDDRIHLDGVGLGVPVGSAILLVGAERERSSDSEAWDLRRVTEVTEIPAQVGLNSDGDPARTVLVLDRPLGHDTPHTDPATELPRCHLLTTSGTLFGANAIRWSDLPASLRVGEISPDPEHPGFLPGPYAGKKHEWVDHPLPAGTSTLWLDRLHPEVAAGSWLVLTRPGCTELFTVTAADHGNHAAFLLAGPSTRVTVSGENLSSFTIRSTAVLAGARELPLGTRPAGGPVTGTTVTVDAPVELERGRLLVVTGTDATTGDAVAEAVTVHDATTDAAGPLPRTRLEFETGLVHTYSPDGLRLRANCARATQGQRLRDHPLGSGDASRPFLTLPLAVSDGGPLTYTATDDPRGRSSSLELRVDGVLWSQVDSLHGRSPQAQVYVVRHHEGSAASVEFGDGVTGARPGSGRDNITATFRVGIGSPGVARPDQISFPMSLPLGLRDVVNPVAAGEAEDPETVEVARVNAPTTVRALDRVVSVTDHEDFARTFAGVGWARADVVDDGGRSLVVVTATLPDGTPLVRGSGLDTRLCGALAKVRFADRPLVVRGHVPRAVEIRARVRLDGRYGRDVVLVAAREAVLALFGRTPALGEAGGFGKLLTPTRVLAVLHRVPGVLGAVLDVLRPAGEPGSAAGVLARPARRRRPSGRRSGPGAVTDAFTDTVIAAEMLEPATVQITEVAL
ncbi:MAG: hypothetical protein QG622_1331 [Actinomycetota bacterium]|nr:hypothetical protein [Actinomycetota bacterium]